MVIEVQLSDACDKCYNQIGGQCRLDSNRNFYCDREKTGKTVLIGTTVASSAGLAVLLFLAFCSRRKLLALASSNLFWRKRHATRQITEAALEQHGPISCRQYSYSEIKKITDCFKTKLGKGGYGTVYKGKLPDERLVAVKVLSQLKCMNEEFINEVASISRTSHVNIVSLLGFCFQDSKRALVYEFMSNGSLEKFIYEKSDCSMAEHQLDCQTLYNIAVGVAKGLEYLHRGCNKTKILHLDIKPHNILLDKEFCPKISDFGLAKILPIKDWIVSILEARGTAGYIAPEVFSRNYGNVSHKSDVFSFGMVVLEMVGGRRNMNAEVDHSSEIYVPQWIYKRLELNQELELGCIRNDTEKEMVRKMIMVSLWCIQTDPSMRPAMSEVVEMLEGSLETLQVPPKPFFFSSSTTPVHSTSQPCEIVQL
ncbi:LEAF RUST 10 DISEASE-RESISTANCE LOCUS RECEPTOR-LIKE PROTEIN KINASE-like 2.1 [Neltuma alba]|uniref:LEAF RUST 10 DISEASE-RESISTANCE LOCUS RECEPTOR-LIKE PROTEIN KINASE-like 2.1 n=1 Tax=Neltuma alba TaxID=207710 RepID=UPI0010A3EFD0|nr:LEAF RUST 10 DISEASE-RESISTANCE LOCUS RECEPTOR-LIKE PROTEIN KINASE-like 2.1 [Prosopis alba]